MAPIDIKITDKESAEEWIKSKLPLTGNRILEAVQDGRATVTESGNETLTTTITTHILTGTPQIDTVVSEHSWKKRAIDEVTYGFRRVWGSSGPVGAVPDSPAVPSRPSLHHPGSIQPRSFNGIIGEVSKFFIDHRSAGHKTTSDIVERTTDIVKPFLWFLLWILIICFTMVFLYVVYGVFRHLSRRMGEYLQNQRTNRTFRYEQLERLAHLEIVEPSTFSQCGNVSHSVPNCRDTQNFAKISSPDFLSITKITSFRDCCRGSRNSIAKTKKHLLPNKNRMAPLFAHFQSIPISLKHGLNDQLDKEGWLTSPINFTTSTKNITSTLSTTGCQSLAHLIARSGGNSDFAGYTPKQKASAENHDAPIAKWAGPMVIGIIAALVLIWCFVEWRHGFPKIQKQDKEEGEKNGTLLGAIEAKKENKEDGSPELNSSASNLRKEKTETSACRSGKPYLECDCMTSKLAEENAIEKFSWSHIKYVLTVDKYSTG
ncbi:hypothetical protein BDZ45DRAFT_724447 [Acephala macrosclerotiorum]|nr:hypothetical protein BDZ45DRAFT_724447 [Acephala macrosclerotiorum]